MKDGLTPDELAACFPFHLALEPDLTLAGAGPALAALLGQVVGRPLTEVLKVERPRLREVTPEALQQLGHGPVVLRAPEGLLALRGQLLRRPDASWLFLGWPWVRSLEDARELGLSLGDLPAHSLISDYLLLLQTQRTNQSDLEALARDLARKQGELGRALEAAEAANRSRDEFLASVSHEIRTPLNAILGFGELLLQGSDDPRLRGYANTLVGAGEHLYALVDDLLDVSQIERGEMVLRPRTFELRESVRQAASLLEAAARSKGLPLRVEIDPSLPLWVHGDDQRLRQVMVNLISNAVKYTERGWVSLRLDPDPAAEAIRFTVEDTGPGIAPKDQARVFDRFVRLQRSSAAGGVGLGLTIARALVGLMGGSLRLESAEGRGTSFRFTLPLPAREPRIATGQFALTPSSGLRILAAEDNPDNRAILTEFLRDSPHTLEFAEDGLQLLDRFRRGQYDLILMDLQMPGLDGYQATAALRELERVETRKRTPVISVSAHAYPQFIARAREVGCDDHLSKPIRQDDLLLLLERYALERSGHLLGTSGEADPAPGALAPATSPQPPTPAAPELAGIPAALRALVPGYLTGQVKRVEQMRQAATTGAWTELGKLAHQLKGTGASYGFPPLTRLAAELEDLAGGGGDRARAEALLDQLARYLEGAQAALSRDAAGASPAPGAAP